MVELKIVLPICLVDENNHGHIELISIKYKGQDNYGDSIVERMFGAAFKIGSDSSVIRELNLGDDFTKYFSFQFSIFSNQTTSSVLPSGTSCTLALMLSFFALKEENLLLHEFINDSIILGAISNNGTVQKLDGDGFVTKCITINNFITTAKDSDDKDYKYFRNKKYLIYPSENQQEFLQVEAQIKKLGIQAKSISNIHDLLEEYKEDTNILKLEEVIEELISPSKYIVSWDHFWKRYQKSIVTKEVSQIIDGLKPQEKERAIDILQKVTNTYYKKYARVYFSQEVLPFRYDVLKVSIIGACIALFGIAMFSEEISKVTLMLGTFFIAINGLIAIAADYLDAYQVYQVIDSKPQDKTHTKANYFKRLIECLKKRSVLFSPIIFYNFGQFVEGIICRVIAIFGIYYATLWIGPWGIVITFLAIFIDFYRGRKKFDCKVINKIKKESVNEFLVQYKCPLDKKALTKILKPHLENPKNSFGKSTVFQIIYPIFDLISPDKYIKNKEQFWERYKNKILTMDILLHIKNSEDKEKTFNRLKAITDKNYEKYGKKYFNREPHYARYTTFLLSLSGAFIVVIALLFFVYAPERPFTAIYVTLGPFGLAAIRLTALIGIFVEVYDSRKALLALQGRLLRDDEKKHCSLNLWRILSLGFWDLLFDVLTEKIIDFVKKGVKIIWEIITLPLRPSTYISIFKNFVEVGEGILWKFIAYYGIRLTSWIGLWGLIFTYLSIPIDFYRGRKKFDYKIINKIKEESIRQFQEK